VKLVGRDRRKRWLRLFARDTVQTRVPHTFTLEKNKKTQARAFQEIAGEFHDDNQIARRKGGDARNIWSIGSEGKRAPRDVIKSCARGAQELRA